MTNFYVKVIANGGIDLILKIKATDIKNAIELAFEKYNILKIIKISTNRNELITNNKRLPSNTVSNSSYRGSRSSKRFRGD